MATIKVMSAGAVQAMVTALGNEFAAANGPKLDLNFATVGTLRDRLTGGEKADLVILSESAIAALEKSGLFVARSRKDLGRTRTGICIREGASKPDISTVDAFKRALLDARVVAYSDPKGGGSSGTFFAGLLESLGIADQVNKKAVLRKRGHEVAEAVARGEADIGSTFVSEILTVKGAVVAGTLPAELDNANTYTAAILAGSPMQAEAAALLAALSDPASRPRWTAAGLQPAF
jgi:molybdate transport system substrate-binding protein